MLKVDKIRARYLHVRGYLSIFAVYICVYIVIYCRKQYSIIQQIAILPLLPEQDCSQPHRGDFRKLFEVFSFLSLAG